MSDNSGADLTGHGITATIRIHKLAWFTDEKDRPERRRPHHEATVNTFLTRVHLYDHGTVQDWLGRIGDIYTSAGLPAPVNDEPTRTGYTPDSNCPLVFTQYEGTLSVTADSGNQVAAEEAHRYVLKHLRENAN